MAIAYFDPKTARGSVDCGRCLRVQFRDMGEVRTSVLFIYAQFMCISVVLNIPLLFWYWDFMYPHVYNSCVGCRCVLIQTFCVPTNLLNREKAI